MKKINTLLIIALCSSACNNSPAPDVTQENQVVPESYYDLQETGVKNGGIKMIPIVSAKDTLMVWTKRIGNNPKIKVLLLHGGPGATHEYFESFESFLPKEGIEFYYYDQLGCGNSNPGDSSKWDLQRFVEEVEQVRTALGLNKDNFYLLGHSWGGILAMEYASKYQDNLKGLIISDMMSSAPAYDKYAEDVLAKKLDPEVLKRVKEIEEKGDFANPQYMELLMPNFYNQFICRLPTNDWPDPLMRAFGKLNQDLYATMQGPSEFGISGKLEKWDRSGDLKNIKTSTLVIGATYDTMDPEHMKWMSTQVQKGRFLLCPEGSHMCMWDDQANYFPGLIQFLKDVNDGKM